MSNDKKSIAYQKFLTNDYDELQEKIKLLRTSNDPELLSFAETLAELDKEDLAPTPAEKKLFKLMLEFKENSLKSQHEQIDELFAALEQSSMARAVTSILQTLETNSNNKFQKLLSYNPNQLQIGHTLNTISVTKLSKTLDQLYEEELNTGIERLRESFENIREDEEKLNKLTDEEKQVVFDLNEMGYKQLADNILNQLTNE